MPGRYESHVWRHDPTLDAPPKYRRACRYDVFIPDPLGGLPVRLPGELAGVVSEAEAAVRGLNDAARPGLRPLARLLLRTEAIASSKVEGMQMGVRELARAEARVDSGGKAGPTALEILANIDAMELAIDAAATAERFSIDAVLAIHARLMATSPNRHIAGRLRAVQNWIGGNDYNPCRADFVPPPPEHLGALMTDLCAAIEDDTLPPLVQAALVHAQFETIHPFEDGNGRTGRALVHVVLRRRGLAPAYVPPISVAFAGARDRYIAGLGDYRADRLERWIEHFAAATMRSARLAASYLDAVESLQKRWRERLAESAVAPRADAAAWVVIDSLPAHPILTAPIAAAATGRSKPQVYRALETLEEAGVLQPLTAGPRNRSWEAAGLLDLIAGLEAGRVPDRE